MRNLLGAVLLGLWVTSAWALSGGTNISVNNGTVAITGQVAVANGGTGANTLTAHGVLVGEGTSPVTAVGGACSANQVLTCNAGGGAAGDPSFAAVTSGFPGTICFGAGMDLLAGSSVFFAGLGGGFDSTEAKVQVPSPGATYNNLRCVANATPGGSGIAVVMMTGTCGSQTASTMTVTAVTANTPVSDTGHPQTITANQCIDFRLTESSTTTTTTVNCCVERTA